MLFGRFRSRRQRRARGRTFIARRLDHAARVTIEQHFANPLGFDDLHAVAEDLIRTGVSSQGHIGISGRSNGGVLVGAAANQRPELYSAVISGSPLTDMRRYELTNSGLVHTATQSAEQDW